MSISTLLSQANEAPLMERAVLQRSLFHITSLLFFIIGVMIIALSVTLKGEAEHIAVIGIAPMIGSFFWPTVVCLHFHKEKGFTGITGLDAFLGCQAIGVAMAILGHKVLHGFHPASLFVLTLLPFILWTIRAHLDKEQKP